MISQFKKIVSRIRNDFQLKLKVQMKTKMSTEKYYDGSPSAINQILMKSTGKNQVNWDDVLQYFQEELQIQQSVKKIQHMKVSASEILQDKSNYFCRLINYIKKKQTNFIQAIKIIPSQLDKNLFGIVLDKQIIFYNTEDKEIISSVEFRYTNVKQKIRQKEENRRIQKQNYLRELETSDKVEPIFQRQDFQHPPQLQLENRKKSRKATPKFNNFLTTNIKSSVRGSEISSEKSNDRIYFRRPLTQQAENKKRQKSSLVKFKNDDIKKIFYIFENAKLENSIAISHAFVEARSTFQKNVILEKSFLQKEPKEKELNLSQANMQKDYTIQLQNMKKLNRKLTIVGTGQQHHHSQSVNLQVKKINKISKEPFNYFRQRREEMDGNVLNLQTKLLGIADTCFTGCYLLVSLFNRQIRLYRLRKALSKIQQEICFEKLFQQIVSYVLLYKSTSTKTYNMAICMQKGGCSNVRVYSLTSKMEIKEKVFEYQSHYFGIIQTALPLGLMLYNQLGNFCVIELNNPLSNICEKVAIETQLFNNQTNYRISITQVRISKNLIYFYLSCSHGYLYLYDKHVQKIKYQMKMNQSSILDFSLIKGDQQIVTILKNGNMVICSALNLSKIFVHQSYREISPESKILIDGQDTFYVYTGRTISTYLIVQNDEKNFERQKPIKILNSRIKLKKKSHTISRNEEKKKTSIIRMIQGKGGSGNYVILFTDYGQLMVFNEEMEYVGSYHFLNIRQITDVQCNQNFQYISVLMDNNSIEVINLYTQMKYFQIQQNQESHHVREQSSFSSLSRTYKRKNKEWSSSGIVHMYFVNEQKQPTFLIIVTLGFLIRHYSSNGNLLFNVDLSQTYNNLSKINSYMFIKGELVCAKSTGKIMVLHKNTYLRKSLITVSDESLIKIRKSDRKESKFCVCVLNGKCDIFFVNLNLRSVQILFSSISKLIPDGSIFNDNYLIQQEISQMKVFSHRQQDIWETSFDLPSEHFYFVIFKQDILRIAKNHGKVSKYDPKQKVFNEITY